VHVWRVTLGANATHLGRLEHHLSADERARAARFYFDQDRRYFIAARGLLREIVSLYLNMLPDRLSFRYGAYGKPFLVQEGYPDLRLNVSHSSGTALFALTQGREVGVDIEHISPDVPVEELAETVFSAPEKHSLTRHGNVKRAAFFRFWTRKEAYIKADGRGVSLPLERIDVSSSEDRVAILDETRGTWRTCERWMLRTFGVGPDHAAAVAAEGQDWHPVCRQWPG
jgi:4'-phosphopantetheinyl transferase